MPELRERLWPHAMQTLDFRLVEPGNLLELPVASVRERPLRRPGQRRWKVGFLLRFHGNALRDDPEGHVGHVWICYQPAPLQLDMFGPQVIEQPHAVSQQHGDNVYVYFVQ